MSKVTEKILAEQIVNNLSGVRGHTPESARLADWYVAVGYTLRTYMGKQWARSRKRHTGSRAVYLLSFEYLPGRLLEKNAEKLGVHMQLNAACELLGIGFQDLLDYELEQGLGAGALGTISMDLFSALTDLDKRAYAYGMRYDAGFLKQDIQSGFQKERSDNWQKHEGIWEVKRAATYIVPFKRFEVRAHAYDMSIISASGETVNPLRLWKAEPTRSIGFESFMSGRYTEAYDHLIRAHNITAFLYPDNTTSEGRQLRLFQAYFYASASVQDIFARFEREHPGLGIEHLSNYAAIHINDCNPFWAILEAVRLLTEGYGFSLEKAMEIIQGLFSYTNFSVGLEGFEVWNKALIEENLINMWPLIEQINALAIKKMRQEGMTEDQVRHLSILSESRLHAINLILFVTGQALALSPSHETVLADQPLKDWVDFKPDLLKTICPGVRVRDWVTRTGYRSLIEEYFGSVDLLGKDPSKSKALMNDPAFLKRFAQDKLASKVIFAQDPDLSQGLVLNPYSLFDVQLSKMHEARRQLLNLLGIAYIFFRTVDQPNLDLVPRTFIFAGKAPANYYMAKQTLNFLIALMKMVNSNRFIREKLRIVYIDNLNIEKSQRILSAANVHQNLTFPTRQSAGTTAIKAMLNGAVNVTTRSGMGQVLYQSTGPENGFVFGPEAHKIEQVKNETSFTARDLYYKHPEIKMTVDRLLNASWSEFPYDFSEIFNNLIYYNDSFFVLRDFPEFIEVQKDVSKTFRSRTEWTKMSFQSMIAGLALSSEKMAKTYASRVWGV